MKARGAYTLPPDKERLVRRAVKLEWATIVLLALGSATMYAVAGSSQAMKTAWIEDVLSLVPPIAYLIAARVRRKEPNERFPYGFHRAVSIAFLCSAVALFGMGAFLLLESLLKLVSAEHPSIGALGLFGWNVWQGWAMLGALAVTGTFPVVLGRLKLPLAKQLHDKALYADADMNKADWLTAAAGIVGVLGIAFGLWWADATAAAFIAFEITRDGVKNLRRVTLDLIDRAPTSVDKDEPDVIARRLIEELEKLDWVKQASVRLREEGHVLAGEAFVVPIDDRHLLARLDQAQKVARSTHWRMCDVVVTAVESL